MDDRDALATELQQCMQQGKVEGEKEKAKQIAFKLLGLKTLSVGEISEATGLSILEINGLKGEEV